VTMTPHLRPRNPETVDQNFNTRHGAGSLPNAFMWAVWAADGSDYLASPAVPDPAPVLWTS
jgi:hypothetical protein